MMAAAKPVSVDWWDRGAPMELRITDYLKKVGGHASEQLLTEKLGISYGRCREICRRLIEKDIVFAYVRSEVLVFALISEAVL